MKTILQLFFILMASAFFLFYLKYLWHYPRSYQYEAKLIQALENLKVNGDTISTFRLDSIMDFKWYKVMHLGAYMDVPEATHKCGIDFSIFRNSRLNTDERFSSLLFLDDQNNPIKFLQFEGLIYGFEQINKKYPCGTSKQNALFRLWQFKEEQFSELNSLIELLGESLNLYLQKAPANCQG